MIKIMFWSEDLKPADCVDQNVPAEKREAIAKILTAGKVDAQYRGIAHCRMCRRMLGSADLTGHGFKWPQNAEHYVLKHGVWLPELDVLLQKAAA